MLERKYLKDRQKTTNISLPFLTGKKYILEKNDVFI